MNTEYITLKLPAEIQIPGSMPCQVLMDTLWTLNLGIQSTSKNVYTITTIPEKPKICSQCEKKAVFKLGSFFYCAEHYRDALCDKITQPFK